MGNRRWQDPQIILVLSFKNFMPKFHKSVVFIVCCLALSFGVFLGTGTKVLPVVIFFLFLAGCFGLAFFWRGYFQLLSFILIFTAAGFGRTLLLSDFSHNPYDKELTFSATIVKDVEILPAKQRLVVSSNILDGLVLLGVGLQPRYSIGDLLEITCTLRRPEPFETFQYDKFLQRYGIGSTCYYPQITKVAEKPGVLKFIFSFKKFLILKLQKSLSAPEHSILLGSLFGVNKALPLAWEEAFRRTGTIHLLVISGSNIVVLSALLLTVLKSLPLSHRTNILLVIGVLALYAIFTGWQPPAVRATFFGSIALVASLLGRKNQALRLLIMVATLMLILNPLLLLFDAGFQLSFLATLGIIVFSKFLEEKLTFLPEFFGLRAASAVTLSATFTTAPLIAYSFHSFSLVTLPANLIVGPLMTAVMLSGVVAVVLAVILPNTLAGWVLLPVYYLIHFTLQVVQKFNQIPYAAFNLPEIPQWLFLLLSSFIFFATWKVYQKQRL
ncbi:MAG: hypothetical protein A2458_03835 [Candidatus Kerfeldbacteria bacterium RIFOXYC2_FULL_38_9]|nr:MAG: hypothetical protein A2458_03835 [Candidatus Kerfeldbacteria bacterium RIFOXYC2_FULL_38_9]